MIDTAKLRPQLRLHEGVKRFPYRDTVGKLSIGVGRNLTDRGLSDDEIEYLLTNDIIHVTGVLDQLIPWWNTLDDVRARVIADMAFNMGPYFVRKWPIFVEQVRMGEFTAASRNMSSTVWARQVGNLEGQRAWRLILMMRDGVEPVAKRKGRSPRRRSR